MKMLRIYDSPYVLKELEKMLGRKVYFSRRGGFMFQIDDQYANEGDWIVERSWGFEVCGEKPKEEVIGGLH